MRRIRILTFPRAVDAKASWFAVGGRAWPRCPFGRRLNGKRGSTQCKRRVLNQARKRLPLTVLRTLAAAHLPCMVAPT